MVAWRLVERGRYGGVETGGERRYGGVETGGERRYGGVETGGGILGIMLTIGAGLNTDDSVMERDGKMTPEELAPPAPQSPMVLYAYQ